MATQSVPVADLLPVPVRIPQVRRILVPIDFSDASLTALRRAIDVARIYHSSLELVHVMANQTSNGMATILPGALLRLEFDLQADLDTLQQLAQTHGVPCTTLLCKGSVVDHVREILSRDTIDLLVLATHGGHGLHGLFLGSIAERLIRATTVPVLTVGSATNHPAWNEKGALQILFAGDFSPETLCGLSLALGIQKTTGARLSVAQVVPRHTSSDTLREIGSHIQSLVPRGTSIYTPEGRVGESVCTLARQLGVGLITLGVHRNSFSREVFGSRLLEILLNAPCPVLSVRQCED